MSENRINIVESNGHTDAAAANKPARKPRNGSKPQQAAQPAQRQPRKPQPRKLSLRQRVAAGIGCVATGVLVLSLWHVTDAIARLTATPLPLALLLAIGIDAGLVACELGAIVGDGRAEKWCNAYVIAAVTLSIGLNGYSSAAAAPDGFAWLSAGLGGTIPMLVYVAARGAAYLWRDRPAAAATAKPA